MNETRMQEIARRSENRRLRAIEREKRRIRRLTKQFQNQPSPPSGAPSIPNGFRPEHNFPNTPTRNSVEQHQKGGCGGCRQRAEKFRKEVKERLAKQTVQAMPKPLENTTPPQTMRRPLPDMSKFKRPTLMGRLSQPAMRPKG